MHWINLAEDRDKLRAFVQMVMNPQWSRKCGQCDLPWN